VGSFAEILVFWTDRHELALEDLMKKLEKLKAEKKKLKEKE
jgi:hypothetical protein